MPLGKKTQTAHYPTAGGRLYLAARAWAGNVVYPEKLTQFVSPLVRLLEQDGVMSRKNEGFIREVPNWVSGMRRKYEWTGQGA